MEENTVWVEDSVDGMPIREDRSKRNKCNRCGDYAQHYIGYARGEKEKWIKLCGPHAHEALMMLRFLDIPHSYNEHERHVGKSCKCV